MKNWFLYAPALFFAPIIIGSIVTVAAVIAVDNALGGPLSRAGAKWVDEQEREAFKDSDLYK